MPSQEIVQTEENILVFDNIFSRGYGFSPQVLTRIPQLSIEAKGLYSYFSSFAGQGGVAFPSTSTILAEMNISKNRFYKYRSELEAWGFITVDIENTRHGRRTVYHLPVEPKPTDKVHELIDEATKARMYKVNNLPNALHADSPTVDNLPAQQDCGKPDFVDKCSYTQTPGHEPRPQNEDLAYPRPQNEDDPCPQNEDMLNIVTSNKGKVTNAISRVAVDNRDQTGSESGAKAPIDTLASSLIDGLSEEEKKAFERLCTVSLKKPNAVRKHQAEKLFTRLMQQGYLPMQVISIDDEVVQIGGYDWIFDGKPANAAVTAVLRERFLNFVEKEILESETGMYFIENDAWLQDDGFSPAEVRAMADELAADERTELVMVVGEDPFITFYPDFAEYLQAERESLAGVSISKDNLMNDRNMADCRNNKLDSLIHAAEVKGIGNACQRVTVCCPMSGECV